MGYDKKRNQDKPNSIKLKYLKFGYHYLISNAMYLFLVPFTIALTHLSMDDFVHFFNHFFNHLIMHNLVVVILCIVVITILATLYFMSRPRKVYLLNFACYKPGPAQMCSKETFMKQTKLTGCFSDESLGFQKKILERSGYGQKTYVPLSLLDVPMSVSFDEARKEAGVVMFGVIDDLLAKTGVKPKDIGILIVNCSLFNPTPSLSAMVVNRYKLRGNILSYNLGGMGCSAGLVSVDLAKRLLQVQPNTYALVVSLEILNRQYYEGNNYSMLITNCLFRTGGAAILFSNRPSDRQHSKYQLVHTLRTHKGADDKCYNCVFQKEDENKKVGILLSRDLLVVAGEALKTNITTLGPLVLPMSEQLLYLTNLIGRKMFKMKIKQYVPDFKLAFEHFCIHAGGRGVLDELEKNLGITKWHMEPSRMTLYRFGNTSSSSLWYELAYSEAKGRIKKGNRVWQIAFGSGFKCHSAVWEALRTIDPAKEKSNVWMNEIHEYPLDVPEVASIDVS
uniref:3-ketoacyl-CoA synthase n=1 Tax=Fagus sylvatica TaxID=28930 RepID=A0A2N9FBE2_FAGSY